MKTNHRKIYLKLHKQCWLWISVESIDTNLQTAVLGIGLVPVWPRHQISDSTVYP